jgi:anti-sigma-K factor RskA
MTEASEELVDYLLGEMDAGDHARLEQRLADDDAMREELERLRPVVTGLIELPDEAWTRLEPPPLALPLVDGGTEPGPSFFDRVREFALGSRVPVLGLAASAIAALAIGVGIGVFASSDGGGGSDPATAVALEALDADAAAQGEAMVIGQGAGGEVELDVSGLAPSDPGSAYELWLLNSADDLVSLGTFTVPTSGEASVSVPLPVEPTEFDFFDVSVERVGGDGSHSGQSVLRGATV